MSVLTYPPNIPVASWSPVGWSDFTILVRMPISSDILPLYREIVITSDFLAGAVRAPTTRGPAVDPRLPFVAVFAYPLYFLVTARRHILRGEISVLLRVPFSY